MKGQDSHTRCLYCDRRDPSRRAPERPAASAASSSKTGTTTPIAGVTVTRDEPVAEREHDDRRARTLRLRLACARRIHDRAAKERVRPDLVRGRRGASPTRSRR